MTNERREKLPNETSTEELSGSAAGAPPPTQRGVTLLVYHPDGVASKQLILGNALVVGRSKSADLCVPNPKLSREHARFTLLEGGVLVEDLGSENGTWVGGKRIDQIEIGLSGEALLGRVAIARVFALGMAAEPAFDSDDAFHRRLDEEVTRAQISGRPFAVLAVRANNAEVMRAANGAWAARLHECLQPIDRVSLYTPHVALILLPERGSGAALEVAQAVASSAADQGGPLLVGIAVYPEAASSAEKLVDRAREAASRASQEHPIEAASTALEAEGDVGDDDAPIIGAAQRQLFSDAERVASSNVPVILHGKTGTGKEVLARFLHKQGRRRGKPFIPVNCGAISDPLVESEFFGHVKGAFTGAIQRHHGYFKAADGGTLFLDEIGELKAAAQVALLRALESGRFTPVGSTQEEKVDVRIIAATHRDLEAMVKDGSFREDLYYRLSTIVLKVPPLCERLDEIDPFAQRFLKQANEEHDRRVRGIAEKAMVLLLAHRWPGNVRELRRDIHRAVLLAHGDLIQPEDLPPHLQAAQPVEEPAPEAAQGPVVVPPPAREAEAEAEPGADLLKARIKEEVKQAVEEALRQTRGNLTEAARLLGVSPRTVARQIKRFGIKPSKR